MKKYVAAALLCATPALADMPVLFGTARVQDGPQAAGFLGTHQVGASLTAAKFGGELAWLQWDRRVELRLGWRTELLAEGPLFLSWRGAGALIGGFAPFDFGGALHTGISAGFGADAFEVYAGAEAGVETRALLPWSLPLRGLWGARVRLDWFELSAQARVTASPPAAGLSRIEGLIVLARLL